MQSVYVGADHAGFLLKQSLIEHLGLQGVDVIDFGAHTLDPHDDYPHYAVQVAQAVRAHPKSRGILICGSAEGVCIAANKFDGIRAGIGFSIAAATSMRSDDDANVLCLPGRLALADDPLAITDAFLSGRFSNATRHTARLRQISNIESRE